MLDEYIITYQLVLPMPSVYHKKKEFKNKAESLLLGYSEGLKNSLSEEIRKILNPQNGKKKKLLVHDYLIMLYLVEGASNGKLPINYEHFERIEKVYLMCTPKSLREEYDALVVLSNSVKYALVVEMKSKSKGPLLSKGKKQLKKRFYEFKNFEDYPSLAKIYFLLVYPKWEKGELAGFFEELVAYVEKPYFSTPQQISLLQSQQHPAFQ